MPLLRRRSSHGLPAVLGVGDMFSTAYGNVGSSIYYALGVTALYAGGMTPVTFAISGVIFAFTAATYAEATARFPEAGGSASFSRRAFNEAVSFFAAWAQMLNYTVTIAISAYTVPPYLSVFPGCGFMRNGLTGQVVVAAGLCIVLALLNIRGIQESARLNIFLAIADLATQALLVVVGVALILDPQVLVRNVHFGTTPTVSAFLISIPIGMVAYTGIETISNMAEEARDPARDVPRSIGLVAAAVFAIYAFLPAVALSAMPMHETPALSHPPGTGGTHYWTALGAKYAGDPVQGIVQNLGLGPADDARELLRRPARGHDPDHRHERRADRRLAPHVLDGRAPAVPRLPAHGAPDLAHAVGRDRRLHVRGDRHDRGRQARRRPGRRVPRQPLRVRRDALVHDRARLGDRAARAQVEARPRAAVPRAHEHPHRRARRAALRGARRPRHVRGLHRRRGALPGRALGGPRRGSCSAWSSTSSTASARACRSRRRCSPTRRCAGRRSRSSTARSCCT